MRSINHLNYHRLWLNKRLISFRKCIPIGRINVWYIYLYIYHKFTWINGLRKPTGNESQTMVKFSDSKWLYDIVNICINWNSLLSTSNLYQHTTLQGYQELFPLNQRLGNMYVYIYICIFFCLICYPKRNTTGCLNFHIFFHTFPIFWVDPTRCWEKILKNCKGTQACHILMASQPTPPNVPPPEIRPY